MICKGFLEEGSCSWSAVVADELSNYGQCKACHFGCPFSIACVI